MNKEAYAPWERGFDSERALRNEPSRVGEFNIKRRPALQPDPNLPTPSKPVPHTVHFAHPFAMVSAWPQSASARFRRQKNRAEQGGV